MRILLVSQYFWPETFIINDIVHTLNQQGHEVVVATGKPNYPEGKIFDGYQEWGTRQEEYQGNVKVFRVPLLPRGKGGSLRLALNYLSFVFSGSFLFPWLLRGQHFDHILVFAPSPITQAIPAIILKLLKRAPLSIWVQDLWPESLSATGHVRNKTLLALLTWMVKGIYSSADKLLIQSPGFHKSVASLANEQKIVYYPNSMCWQPELVTEPLPEILDNALNHSFCLVFAGNIGKAQSFETVIEAAKILKDLPHIRIVIVGSGSMLDWVKQQKQEYRLNNLVLAGRYPMSLMPAIYAKSSALLVTLKRDEIFNYTIPSKIQAYLAAGKPIIAALDGTGASIIAEACAGFTCKAEDSIALAECIKQMHKLDNAGRNYLGDNGRTYFMKYFEMSAQVKNLVKILNNNEIE